MKHESLDEAGLSYAPCRYGLSRLYFRGPRQRLDGRYVAFLGGTETYGKFIAKPFPELVEKRLGRTCVNFGVVNASVDAFMHEPSVLAACHDAEATVIQIMGTQNISNRFYTVHPRRNDRFVRASTVLQAVFSEIDFSEFSFTRHMLRALYKVSPDRFQIVRHELQQAWVHRMKALVAEIETSVLLLWFADHPLSDDPAISTDSLLHTDPLFVTRAMVEEVLPMTAGLIEAQPSEKARAAGTEGMIYSPLHSMAAAELMGVRAHEEAADLLAPVLKEMIRRP